MSCTLLHMSGKLGILEYLDESETKKIDKSFELVDHRKFSPI